MVFRTRNLPENERHVQSNIRGYIEILIYNVFHY